MLRGPKDEGLALRRKCEEISRHLSTPLRRRSTAQHTLRLGELGNGNEATFCSPVASSRPPLSPKQIYRLLGTSPLFKERKREDENVVEGPGLPPFASSLDVLALFIYTYGGLHVPELRLGDGQDEEAVTPGVLRALVMRLKRIHDDNFYRSPEDKIANAFAISVEKRRVDRRGLSSEWDFYGATHHPKMPSKEKLAHARIVDDLLALAAKRAGRASTRKSSRLKKPQKEPQAKDTTLRRLAKDTTSRRLSSKSRAPITRPESKSEIARKNNKNNAKCRSHPRRRFTIRSKDQLSSAALRILELPQTAASREGDVRGRRPSNLGLEDGLWKEVLDSDIGGGHQRDGVGERPFSTQSKITVDGGRRLRRCGLSDLPSRIMKRSFGSKDSPGGLSTLARIDQLFAPLQIDPTPDFWNNSFQVEISRLKILRW